MPGKGLEYALTINSLMQKIVESQMENIERAAQIVAEAIAGNGILYTFGTGHSHVVAEDVAFRAGGLVPVDAILEASLTGHEKVRQSEYMERVEGMAAVIIEYYGITSRDALVVISNSDQALSLAQSPIPLPAGIPEWLTPQIAIIPGQLFAYHLTRAKGYNPETPRSLHKVTQTH